MLELHQICLSLSDKEKLRKVCETHFDQIRYKDALALIQVNQ